MNRFCFACWNLRLVKFSVLLCALFAVCPAMAAVQRVAPSLEPLITFDEIPPLTENPVYTVGGTTVRFGSLFEGQSLGAAPNSLLDSSPDNPLMLSTSGPAVATTVDLSNPSLLVLGSTTSGSAYVTPLAVFFDDPVNCVEFDLGALDAAGTTNIEAYDAEGNTLASIQNVQGGLERIGLADDEGRNVIAGISIFVGPDGMDWEGFALDNLSFSFADPGDGVVPEPATIAIWCVLALIAAPFVVIRKR